MKTFISLLLLSCLVSTLQAQTVTKLDAKLWNQKSDNSAVEILEIDNKIILDYPGKNRAELVATQMQKFKNLRSLNIERFHYRWDIDTIMTFDPETFDEVAQVVENPKLLPPNYLLDGVNAPEKLEHLGISFNNLSTLDYLYGPLSWQVQHALFEDLRPCLEEIAQNTVWTTEELERHVWSVLEAFREGKNGEIIGFQQVSSVNKGLSLKNKALKAHEFVERVYNSEIQEFMVEAAQNCTDKAFFEHWSYLYHLYVSYNYYADRYKVLIAFWDDAAAYLEQGGSNHLAIDDLQRAGLQFDNIIETQLYKKYGTEFSVLNELGMKGLVNNLKRFKNLKILEIRDCPNLDNHWDSFIVALETLPQLEKLVLTNCNLQAIPENLARLQQLKALHLNENKIKDIPAAIFMLPDLKELNLSKNNLRALDGIEKAKALEYLDISYNDLINNNLIKVLEKLPIRVEKLNLDGLWVENEETFYTILNAKTSIKELSLQKMGLQSWPNLPNCTEIHLENNGLYNWPNTFVKKTDFYLAHNLLPKSPKALPKNYKGANSQDRQTPTKGLFYTKNIENGTTPSLEVFPAFRDQDVAVYLAIAHEIGLLQPIQHLKKGKHKDNWRDFQCKGTLQISDRVQILTEQFIFNEDVYQALLNDAQLRMSVPLPKRGEHGYLKKDKNGEANIRTFLNSTIYFNEGLLVFDAASNKLGYDGDFKYMPSLEIFGAKVFYNYPSIDLHSKYNLYVDLEPFILDKLLDRDYTQTTFKGKLNASQILCDFECEITLMEKNLSLGFSMEVENLPLYMDYKGESTLVSFTGVLELSNDGLLAKGELICKGEKVQADLMELLPRKIHFYNATISRSDGTTEQLEEVEWNPYSDDPITN